MRHCGLHILLLLLSSAVGSAQTITVNQQIFRVSQDDVFEVVYTISGAGVQDYSQPDFKNFLIAAGPNTQSSYSWVNGKSSRNYSISYYLRPTASGTFRINPMVVNTGKKKLSSPKVTVSVSPSKNKASPGSAGTSTGSVGTQDTPAEDVFITIEIDTNQVYQGQQINAHVNLYSVYDVTNYNIFEAPKLSGFWMEDITPKRGSWIRKVIGNKQYKVLTIKKYALFPQQAGKLELDQIGTEVTIRTRAKNSRGFFQRYNSKRQKIYNEPVEVNVIPLPEEGKPASFRGAVGTGLRITNHLNKNSCLANEAVKLTYVISGKGNLKLIEAFELNLREEFDVYDPEVTENIRVQNDVITGSRTFEYVIIPRKEMRVTIPQIKFVYFDPVQGTYQNAISRRLSLSVGEAAADPAGVEAGKEKAPDDIKAIFTSKVNLHKKTSSFWGSPVFFVLFLLPLLLFPAVMVYKSKQDEKNADVLGLKRKQANKVALKRLEVAQSHLNQNAQRPFYDEVIKAVWGYLSDRVNIPIGELSKENILEVLKNNGVSEQVSEQVISVIQYCEMALFAPVPEVENLQKTYDRSLDLIADLEEELK